MSRPLTVECDVHFGLRHRGRKELNDGPEPECPSLPSGRVPRIARLMALAIRFERLIRDGKVADYAELARVGHVSRARITQIMNLLLFAPDIQEQILFLPQTEHGRDPIRMWQLQPITTQPDWRRQRRMWRELRDRAYGSKDGPASPTLAHVATGAAS